MQPELYTEVVLLKDFPQFNLKAGDTAMYIEHLTQPEGEDGAILEIFNAVGDSIGIATIPLSAIAPITADYLPAVRPVKAS